jgi:hypothetical protein
VNSWVQTQEHQKKKRKEKGTFFNLILGIYENHTTNIKLNSRKLNAFSFSPGTNEKYSMLSSLFSIILGAQDNAIRHEKEYKNPYQKDRCKISYLQTYSIHRVWFNLSRIYSVYSCVYIKSIDRKIQKLIVFLYISNE